MMSRQVIYYPQKEEARLKGGNKQKNKQQSAKHQQNYQNFVLFLYTWKQKVKMYTQTNGD